MKKFVYLITLILILSIGSLFVLKSPKGKPWLNISDFYDFHAISQKAISIKNTVFNRAESLMNNESDPSIYKWQDEQGVWHYSDKKQPNGKVWIKPQNLTVIPAIEPLEKEEVKSYTSEKKLNGSGLNTKSGNKVKDLINDTNNVQELMNNRTKNIDKQLEQYQ